MKVTHPEDLQARIIAVTQRVRLIADALSAFGTGEHDPSADALAGLGDIADEVADELEAIEQAHVRGANELRAHAPGLAPRDDDIPRTGDTGGRRCAMSMSALVLAFTRNGGGDDGARLVETAAVLTVEFMYLHHTRPHFSDTAERKAEKARASDLARRNERTFQWEYPKAVSRWTKDDLLAVVDSIREQMPIVDPDGADDATWRRLPDERFRDGRALQYLSFYVRRSRQSLWFSTAAGYAADVALGDFIPPAALIPFAVGIEGMDVDMRLNARGLRAMARAGDGRPEGGA